MDYISQDIGFILLVSSYLLIYFVIRYYKSICNKKYNLNDFSFESNKKTK